MSALSSNTNSKMHRTLSALRINSSWRRILDGNFKRQMETQSLKLSTSKVFHDKSNPQNLPHLPVPTLEQTLDKYLISVEPFLDEKELQATKKIAEDFKKGIGKTLQECLVKRAKETDNWLAEWWLNTAYLTYRDPVVVYSSPGLVLPFVEFKDENDRLCYAVKLILAAIDYKLYIDCGKMPVEKMGKEPLDMGQYNKIFGTCRIPGIAKDCLEYHPDSKHIIVAVNNHFFKLQVIGDDGEVLSQRQLFDHILCIVEESSSAPSKDVGVLTTEHRDRWGNTYQKHLIKDETNKKSLKAIQESLFLVCLDGPVPESEGKSKAVLASEQLIHGGGAARNACNRWYDKTVQFIIGQDGTVGLTYEHSPAEGQPIAVMTDYLVDYINKNSAAKVPDAKNIGGPEKLEFNVDSETKKAIEEAKCHVKELVDNLDIASFKFEHFGKDFIKSQKLSPDSFIQMALQYAFYRIHKVPGAHYESAATRKYFDGRTETIRSCSNESICFAHTMLNSSADEKQKVEALKAAINGHKKYTVEALGGFGVDRHLLGLKLIALEIGQEIPSLYKDAGFLRSTRMRISSSQVAVKCDGFMVYGPLVDDGYGACYNPRPNDINFGISAFVEGKNTSAAKYREALEESLCDMQNILLKTQKAKL